MILPSDAKWGNAVGGYRKRRNNLADETYHQITCLLRKSQIFLRALRSFIGLNKKSGGTSGASGFFMIVGNGLFGVLDVGNFDFEDEHCVRTDTGLGNAVFAVGEFTGDVEDGFTSFTEHFETVGKTGDYARG